MARRHLDNGWLGQYVSGAKKSMERSAVKLAVANKSRNKVSNLTNKEIKARERNIASAYFSQTPTISNLYNGAKHWLTSMFTPNTDVRPVNYNTGDVPTPNSIKGVSSISNASKVFKPVMNYVNSVMGKTIDVGNSKAMASYINNRGFRRYLKAISPEDWTSAQDAAVAQGDMNQAQLLRDLHRLAYSNSVEVGETGMPRILYHQTNGPFNIFRRPGKHSNTDVLTPYGVFTKRTAKDIGLGDYQMPLYVDVRNPWRVANKKELLERLPSPMRKDIEDFFSDAQSVKTEGDYNNMVKRASNIKTRFTNLLKDSGYDGLRIEEDWAGTGLKYNPRNTDATIALRPGQVKSSKAVTYDDNDVRIPLGERDNRDINDIRYGIIPLLLGAGVGYGAYNNTTHYKYGGIHIDPANRGALTETMRRTGKTKYQLAHSKNPLTRKRAQFAINAAKWNH